MLGVSPDPSQHECQFEKPHGVKLLDGRIICWGNGRDWKSILFSAYERSYQADVASAHGVALFESSRTTEAKRQMIYDAARRLGVATVVWSE